MPSRPTFHGWVKQIAETNKCAADYLAGKVPQHVMDNFFDHESGMFQDLREQGVFDVKDWSEDFNR